MQKYANIKARNVLMLLYALQNKDFTISRLTEDKIILKTYLWTSF